MTVEHGSGTKMLLSFVGGAVAGAAVALLLAPKSGKETREQLGEYLHTGVDRTKHLPGAIKAASGAAREAFHGTMADVRS